MRQQIPVETQGVRHARTWAAYLLNPDILALGAALGLIAAIAFGAPHLRLL